jgi:hypothetical protein
VDVSGNFNASDPASGDQYSGFTTDSDAQGSMQFGDAKCQFSANVNWTFY